ncbi:hypothetical protein D9758_000119 [Tetrapyrgos nigripes]|uniref:Uncharacterized protein n=1 Tax=Tetrapyrgos nigripes TaxID=182062 RepID=A0A8H5LYU7_9AGAR|nr:hypothetical protein D9758_000119 [Tetrapyrgos nigripes]
MASAEPDASSTSSSTPESSKPQDTSASEEKVATHAQSDSDDKQPVSSLSSSPRPLRIYTSSQLVALSKSPLVCLPNGMPELKDWFGIENEQNLSKKESEPTTPSAGRERRFRRDADDGEPPSRPSFRSSLSQPSQMGNFKHQSLRSTDRDGDKDRDREGQERLRNLSDKYDRDRLGLPLGGLRSKERDVAPHLAGSSRLPNQAQGIAARRAETREANKKKAGETGSEDWRRDSRRSERTENGRPDRDDRERPRSRVRESSRHRRDPSTSRREDGRRERDREREEYRKERDRDEQRRERERDNGEDDDSRRWRDDGRREERVVARRERERNRDKPPHDGPSDGDRRWTVVEDRDTRTKRGVGKDKKLGVDEGKVEERRGDRDKEKEPAWMDTYIPAAGSAGILGGKGNDGELDGIQAWKKSVKEKEQKANKAAPTPANEPPTSTDASQKSAEEPLDEIQRFKKLMELAQKQSPSNGTESLSASGPIEIGPVLKTQESKMDSAIVNSKVESTLPAADPSRSLLSLLNPSEPVRPAQTSSANLDSASKPSPKPIDTELLAPQPSEPGSAQFNPPQGPRLLALGRGPGKPSPLNSQSLVTPSPNGPLTATSPQTLNPRSASSGFSPFEEHPNDTARRVSGERSPFPPDSASWPDSPALDSVGAGQGPGRGSRFAKFFDSKGKDTPASVPNVPKSATPTGLVSSSPIPGSRVEGNFGIASAGHGHEHRTVDDLFAKLSMSSSLSSQRSTQVPNSAPMSNVSYGQQAQNHLQVLQQQIHSQNHLVANNRSEPLYDSRNFMPDGLVPGLRSAPPPRRADGGPGMYSDPLDDALMLNAQQQRLALQQQRGVDQLYSAGLPAGLAQHQSGRNIAIPIQQQPFRGGPSPSNPQASLHNVQQQRLPPGLANLGGRPPHDPSQQYLAMQGMNSQGLHGLHVNGPPQQFNNFGPGGNLGFNGPHGQIRGGGGSTAHQLNSLAQQQQLGNLAHAGNLDVRGGNQAQFLALNGLGSGGLRNAGGGGFNPQQNNTAQLQNQLLGMRPQQQQQQQLPPHMMQHLGPMHLQQQGPSIPNHQPNTTQDLMALLLGGSNHHRE